ncbi:MAG: vitamin K epoxide reductase family protein [Pyrinomonadaceae bacterium]
MSARQEVSVTANPKHDSCQMSRRHRRLYAVAAVISLLGLADALYLTIEHITGQSVRCTIVAGCSEVLSSSYAVVAGVPLAGIGAAAYFSAFSLATFAAFGYRIAASLLVFLVCSMSLVALWLIYLQAYVIRAFCQFCLLSAAITFVLTALVVIARSLPVSNSRLPIN